MAVVSFYRGDQFHTDAITFDRPDHVELCVYVFACMRTAFMFGSRAEKRKLPTVFTCQLSLALSLSLSLSLSCSLSPHTQTHSRITFPNPKRTSVTHTYRMLNFGFQHTLLRQHFHSTWNHTDFFFNHDKKIVNSDQTRHWTKKYIKWHKFATVSQK